MTSVSTFIWFDSEAEQAAEFYAAAVPDSRITGITRNADGSAFVATLELAGHAVTLMNGGPGHPHTDAASIQVLVDGQDEVDRLWAALTTDGKPGPCGWLTDRYGLSWQVVPSELPELLGGEHAAAVGAALNGMSKIDLPGLREAHLRG
ncbi:VOC family protein [Nocardia sp. CA2R105]|uniref:VOC family protein n=1 Tax=Nocardia coffeae TaxID=2873381 RepID=UPI001CA72FEB|nr:VOC family protein [Nocardia coffeae]MBY8862988.1 VOC family protein [Nocardia coffeae]